jgi:retron-type reverse transcriptase
MYGLSSSKVQSYQKSLMTSQNFRLVAVHQVFLKFQKSIKRFKQNSNNSSNCSIYSSFNKLKLVESLLNLETYSFSLSFGKLTNKTWELTISSIKDMCVQMLFKLILEPVVEVFSDKNSYGFRRNRSSHQALACLGSLLKNSKAKIIFKGSIQGFFDKDFHR